ALYANYCVSCHGPEKKGDEQLGYPSLAGIRDRMTKEQVIAKVNTGGGKMPGFASIIKGQEDAITAFLFDITGGPVRRMPGLTQNANPDIDTLPRWMNITAYSSWTVQTGTPAPGARRGGVQAIKGPW